MLNLEDYDPMSDTNGKEIFPLDLEAFSDQYAKITPLVYRLSEMDGCLLATVDAISSEWVLLRVGDDLFKIVVPRKWLPAELLLGYDITVMIKPLGCRKETEIVECESENCPCSLMEGESEDVLN